MRTSDQFDAYLEIGKRRTFAGATNWPGWCRSGRDEEAALQALLDYGPRYAHVLRSTSLEFRAPGDLSAFSVVERLEGDATTDYGAPGAIPSADAEGLGDAELRRLQTVLEASWQTFDAAVKAAEGKELRKGPRGGGRDLTAIIQHVVDADAAYLGRLGQKYKTGATAAGEEAAADELDGVRQAILDALVAGARGEIPAKGPRGGVRWPARYFARRVTWHVLDHAWEIEDRIT